MQILLIVPGDGEKRDEMSEIYSAKIQGARIRQPFVPNSAGYKITFALGLSFRLHAVPTDERKQGKRSRWRGFVPLFTSSDPRSRFALPRKSSPEFVKEKKRMLNVHVCITKFVAASFISEPCDSLKKNAEI